MEKSFKCHKLFVKYRKQNFLRQAGFDRRDNVFIQFNAEMLTHPTEG